MKKLSVAWVVLVAVLLPMVAEATGEWAPWSKVHIIYTHSSGRVSISVREDHINVNPSSCTSESYLTIRPENKAYDEIYKMVLTAKAANKDIRLYVAGCYENYPEIHHAMIK